MSEQLPAVPVMKPFLGEEEAVAAADAVRSGWVAQGPRVAEFERRFSEQFNAAHSVALSSCTTALQLALHLLNLEPGDEVIVPSLSFIATANAARVEGYTPVFAEIDVTTGNLTAATIEQVITPRTRAVIVVHQTGIPADLDAIHEVCDPRGVAVIEDAACGIGATYKGRPIGGHSDFVAFSFHPRKVITTGEGGLLTVRGADVDARARRLREHGMSMSAADRQNARGLVFEEYDEPGFNYRMTDIQAAVGLVQLGRLDEIVERRRNIAKVYQAALAGIDGLVTANDPDYGTTNFQSFWVLLPDDLERTQREVMESMLADGVTAKRGVMASHLETAYAGYDHVPLPLTEKVTQRSVILPLFHTMTDGDIERVHQSFVAAVHGRR